MSRQDKLLHETYLMDDRLPSKEEFRRRQMFYERLADLRLIEPLGPGPFPSIEDMIREDRDR